MGVFYSTNKMNNTSNRYSRQILFIGEEGQKLLGQSHAIIIGCGALGGVSASLLTRAGVGRIKIIDRDFIEENNLQRQILFNEEDIKNGLPKAIAAQEKLRKVNSDIEIEGVVADLNYTNIEKLLDGADVIVDGLDNFETRFLLNDYCVKNSLPWIYGACVGSAGLTMNIVPAVKTPCLRCVLESLPPAGTSPTCDTAGILAPIAAVIASIQATEAVKLLTNNAGSLNKDLIKYDIWDGRIQKIHVSRLRTVIQRDPYRSLRGSETTGAISSDEIASPSARNDTRIADCPTCQKANYEFLNAEAGSWTTTICGRNGVQITPLASSTSSPLPSDKRGLRGVLRRDKGVCFDPLASRLRPLGDVQFNKFMLKFTPAPNGVTGANKYELAIFPDGRAIITGTTDAGVAKGLYAKYIGI